jgi:hypothetical protein
MMACSPKIDTTHEHRRYWARAREHQAIPSDELELDRRRAFISESGTARHTHIS